MRNKGIKRAKLGRMLVAASALSVATALGTSAAYAQEATRHFNVPAQPLGRALLNFGRQAGVSISAPSEVTRGRTSQAISGQMTTREALTRLLGGAGLSFEFVNPSAVRVYASPTVAGSAAANSGSAGEDQTGIAEILVVGSRSQNVDIRRSEDDPQPYVVFSREEIEDSNASSPEEFLRTRLPMNTQSSSRSQSVDSPSAAGYSEINLRGLGINQTLILIDGRRAPRVQPNAFDFTQADINGIPLSAIERIEVLPSTAGGIYGGGATGGVINIIRKRDYQGLDVSVSYDGTFRGGGETFRAEISGGFSPNSGRTQVNFSASRTASRPLYVEDNDLWRRSRSSYEANEPFQSPFAAYTANIQSADRSPLVLKPEFGGVVLGSNHTFIPVGYSGVSSDSGAALIANAGQYNLELTNDPRGRFAYLRNSPRIQSANVNINHAFSDAFEGFIDLTISDNKSRSTYSAIGQNFTISASSPSNPFQQAVQIFFPTPDLNVPREFTSSSRTLNGTVGAIVRLGHGWSSTAEYSFSESRINSIYTSVPIRSSFDADLRAGIIDIFRDTNQFPIDYSPYLYSGPDTFSGPYRTSQQIASARISGPLVELGGGPLNLTALAEHRSERARQSSALSSFSFLGGISLLSITPARSQSVNSGYVELVAPLVSERNSFPLVSALDIQMSLRYDDYTTRAPAPSVAQFFAPLGEFPESVTLPEFTYTTNEVRSVNYVLAARWAPVRGISLRASYSTGFLPPSISQLVSERFPGSGEGVNDPKRGNEPIGSLVDVPLDQIFGGNADLRPEESSGFSFGAILNPRILPGFRLSIDYSRIRKRNEIGNVDVLFLVANEDSLPGRIVRGGGPQPGDQPGWAEPIILIDTSLININRSSVEAIDFQTDYTAETRNAGNFHFYAVATRTLEFRRQVDPSVVSVDSVDFSDGPLKWRGNVGLNWTMGHLSVGWNAQYYSSYSIRTSSNPDDNYPVMVQGAERVPSQMYHDLSFRYRFGGEARGLLNGLDLSLGIQNVFDRRPPVIASRLAGYSTYGDPRLRRFTLTLRKHFGR